MNTHCLEVRGDFACFTRPEMKVERVSYDVITPSAARGIDGRAHPRIRGGTGRTSRTAPSWSLRGRMARLSQS